MPCPRCRSHDLYSIVDEIVLVPPQVAAMRSRLNQPVLAADIEYASLTAAAEALQVTRPAIAYRIAAGFPGYARLDHGAPASL